MNSRGFAPRHIAILVGALALAVALGGSAGCTKPVSLKSDGGTGPGKPDGGPAADPWPTAAAQLRKDADAAGVRRTLLQLNADLAAAKAESPPPLPADAMKAIVAVLPLTDDEQREIAGAAFTPLDGSYLADCLYLADAVRSLDLGGLPPARQAELAFDWVCRQVALSPWARPLPNGQLELYPPVPATYVLRRGYGTGLERGYAFLAALQQLGLDGCLVGPPAAAASPGHTNLRGPFWAVGVRVGGDVLLFNPWRGEPFPGAAGVGTLAQVKANADALKPWFDDTGSVWNATAADVAAGEVFLAVPLSGVAPRMRAVEEKLGPAVGVRTAADPLALRDRFVREAVRPPLAPEAVRFWLPPDDPFSYTRVLAYFLPADEGGWDRGPQGAGRIFDLYRAGQLPRIDIPLPPDVQYPREAYDRLLGVARSAFAAGFLVPPVPRERLQRGQFTEVTQRLVAREREFSAAAERSRGGRAGGGASAWVGELNKAYGELSQANISGDPVGKANALAAVEKFWQEKTGGAAPLVDQAVAEIGLAESAFLLALCKHEQAERAQVRVEKAADGPARDAAAGRAKDAWATADDSWQRYQPYSAGQSASFPGRPDHVRRLAARAAKLAANPLAGP